MKETGHVLDLSSVDSLYQPGVPDFGHNRTHVERMEIHEEAYTGERTIRENTIIRMMNAMIESGDLTFTSDRRAVLRWTVPAEKNHPSFYIEISEDLLS